jgi:DNA/RNA endonuclease YhcR with UshA esterase domain
MKIFWRILLSLAVFGVLAFTEEAVPTYNPAQQQTVHGIVQELKDYQCPVSGTIGAHISINSGSETIEVHLAPARFLKEYGITIKEGDSVTVIGMKFTFNGKPAMMAKTVVTGRSTFTFRDDKGRPEW